MGTATPKSSVISVSIQSKISGVPLIAYRNQRVITSELLARGYGATPQQITNNFNRNKNRFIEGKHYFRIEGDDVENLRNSLRGVQISPMARTLYLWTERGASRHAKMLETDQAWDFYEDLEENYFRQREIGGIPLVPDFSDPARRLGHGLMSLKQDKELNSSVTSNLNTLNTSKAFSPTAYPRFSSVSA
jgi:hypothetical protein